ncbi:lactate utilization protein C [Helicobacter sp. MIT 21-1697]|uniref:LutC/YkgG family protein n=1 Tax=Helicobacter sp. MIT 21-1697 TaxID=2993733 RepID=UPI00224B781A|nr:lactate utilization protein C [Helicobacter sp. MIT 21-1697]MCX2716212.1 lactate utilization protein C [Helicobacter sp. MIT 21-1697]
MSKQAILDNIRASLQANTLQSQSSHYGNPIKSVDSDKVQEYISLQNANKAIVIESNPNTLAQDICKTLTEAQARKILYNLDITDILNIQTLHKNLADSMSLIPYEKSVDEAREALFSIDTSIVQARCGVANLGIIGITSSARSPRLSSLITRTCIVLLKKQDIVSNLYEGVQILKSHSENEKLPSNMIFIAGPSRTADIELQTVFGVHGSLRTYVILY